ncbi:MAG: ribokinase, partial [bacterium]
MNKDKKTPSILVIGSLNMDLVMNCDRVPEAGESLMGEKYNYVPGGKGANQAVAAAKMGAEVSFAGKRGADSLGNKLEQNLGKYRINTDFLKVDENHRTGLASIMVDKTGENRILVFPGANMEIQWEEIKPVFKENFDALLLQLEIPEKINIKAVREAKKHDIPVILDTGPAQSFSLEKIKGVKILSPNETEAYSLTGIKINNKKDAEKAARNLAG